MNSALSAVSTAAIALAIVILLLVFTARRARQRGIEEGRRQFADFHQRQQEAAVHLFLSRLTSLVTRPCEENATAARARAIIGVVEAFHNALTSITAPLAAEIQDMKTQLTRLSEQPSDGAARERLLQTMSALREGWPDKKHVVETIVRQLLAQLSTTDTTPRSDEPTL